MNQVLLIQKTLSHGARGLACHCFIKITNFVNEETFTLKFPSTGEGAYSSSEIEKMKIVYTTCDATSDYFQPEHAQSKWVIQHSQQHSD